MALVVLFSNTEPKLSVAILHVLRLFRKQKSLLQHFNSIQIQGFVETLQIMSFQNDG